MRLIEKKTVIFYLERSKTRLFIVSYFLPDDSVEYYGSIIEHQSAHYTRIGLALPYFAERLLTGD